MPFGPDPSRVPEPGTLVMTGMGSMALLIAHRLRRRPKASGLVEGVGLRTSRQLEVE
jgi:hypothetical protein